MFYVVDGKKIVRTLIVVLILGLVAYAAYKAFTIYYPLKHQTTIEKYANQYGLDSAFVCAVIRTESRFEQDAVSPKGASGLMQIAKITADWGADEIGLDEYDYSRIFEPEINIQIGCWYLARLFEQYGVKDTVLAAYNAGSGNVSKWLSNSKYSKDSKTLFDIPFGETKRYVERVNQYYGIYKRMLNFLHS